MKTRNVAMNGFVILFVAALIYFIKPIRPTPNASHDEAVEEETFPKQSQEEVPQKPPFKMKPFSSITADDLKTFRNALPDKAEIKSEVGKNPHRTPDSLVLFAERMGPLVEKALTNDSDADLLIVELHDCVMNETIAQAGRALCLSNAEKLGGAHPQMREKVGEIRSHAPTEVTGLVDKKNLLLRK